MRIVKCCIHIKGCFYHKETQPKKKTNKNPNKAKKKKILRLAHLANGFLEAGIQGRLGAGYPEVSSDLSRCSRMVHQGNRQCQLPGLNHLTVRQPRVLHDLLPGGAIPEKSLSALQFSITVRESAWSYNQTPGKKDLLAQLSCIDMVGFASTVILVSKVIFTHTATLPTPACGVITSCSFHRSCNAPSEGERCGSLSTHLRNLGCLRNWEYGTAVRLGI